MADAKERPVQQRGGAPEQTAPTASNETVRDKFMRKASENPRFREVKNPGKGFVIVGAKP